MRLLPHAALRGGPFPPFDLHLVLTGAGGGTWDLRLGGDGAAACDEVMLLVDAVDFCRLVANRVDPGTVDVLVTGHADDAQRVLRAAATLALD